MSGDGDGFVDEFINSTKDFGNVFYLSNIGEYNQVKVGNSYQVRFVDFSGMILHNGPVPDNLHQMQDDKVTAVSFSGSVYNKVDYFQKEGGQWKKTNKNDVRVVSLGGERDAAKYGAIFSADADLYRCNMGKAFKRLEMINEVYGGNEISHFQPGNKLEELINIYNPLKVSKPLCIGHLGSFDDNMKHALGTHQSNTIACLLSNEEQSCLGLVSSAGKIRDLNEKLNMDCLTLY